MKRAPLILITSSRAWEGEEFQDDSLSLSHAYTGVIQRVGGIPWVMPVAANADVIAESVRRADGVLLTGGDDVQVKLYRPDITRGLKKTLGPADPARDLLEVQVIREVFRQGRPLLAICRGQQILNVAFGGDLIVDIATQVPRALNHQRMDKKGQVVHEITLESDSMLASLCRAGSVGVNSTHHQAVNRVAPPFRAVARSADGVVEALELGRAEKRLLPYLMAVQFHPERLLGSSRAFLRLFQSFVVACGSLRRNVV